MILKDLIEYLKNQPQETLVLNGFEGPHSYRGSYCELAFKPAKNVTVASMLACAKEALGATYTGYKGGEFTMCEYTNCYLAEYGECGEMISVQMLVAMISEAEFLRMKNALAGRDPEKLEGLLEAVRMVVTEDSRMEDGQSVHDFRPDIIDLANALAAFEGRGDRE